MRGTGLTIGVLGALLSLLASVNAGSNSDKTSVQIVASRPIAAPVIAIVSLSKQQITIYDKDGWIMRAPVSSGREGYETPAGVYTIIQKEAEHYSNLYDDGYMPFMQRITWSGIALHGGPLPGYPASHGCVRMPLAFADRLFGMTQIGMRVLVARTNPVPVDFSHPVLTSLAARTGIDPSAPGATELAGPASTRPRNPIQLLAAQKAAEAQSAAAKAEAARLQSIKKTLENSRISATLHLAESAKSRLALQLELIQKQLDAASTPDAQRSAEETKAKVLAKFMEAEAKFNAAAVAAEHRPDVVQARAEAEAAEAESNAAAQAAAEAARKAAPISIFISRKTQRLYVRQSFEPLFDTAIAFREPDQPIGTHVFTALDYAKDGPELRWNVVSLGARDGSIRSVASALEAIVIAPEEIARISELLSPGSSLIISDEGPSSETANDTDFIVIMSDEPQGGIKRRHRNTNPVQRYYRSYDTFFWR